MPGPIGSARPGPGLGNVDQTAPHRIAVNVRNRLMDGGRTPQIAVVSWSRLPKAVIRPTAVLHGQALQKARRLPAQILDGQDAHRSLDPREDVAHSINRQPRTKQQMHMLRHDDPRPQIELARAPCPFQRFDESVTRSILAEQGKSPIAREGEKVGVPLHVEVLRAFTMSRWRTHVCDDSPRRLAMQQSVTRDGTACLPARFSGFEMFRERGRQASSGTPLEGVFSHNCP